jgi:hypothetical protein
VDGMIGGGSAHFVDTVFLALMKFAACQLCFSQHGWVSQAPPLSLVEANPSRTTCSCLFTLVSMDGY